MAPGWTGGAQCHQPGRECAPVSSLPPPPRWGQPPRVAAQGIPGDEAGPRDPYVHAAGLRGAVTPPPPDRASPGSTRRVLQGTNLRKGPKSPQTDAVYLWWFPPDYCVARPADLWRAGTRMSCPTISSLGVMHGAAVASNAGLAMELTSGGMGFTCTDAHMQNKKRSRV